MNILPVESS